MSSVEALGAQDITKVGLILIVAFVVIGALLSIVVTAIVGRLIVLAVVVIASVLVWQQRSHIQDRVSKQACDLNATFFGVHLDPPDDVKRYCARQHQAS